MEEKTEAQISQSWWQLRLGWHGNDYAIPTIANRLPYFLGGLTLCGILTQILTGIYLAQYYNPDPLSAHSSIIYIVERAWLGDFVRSLHLWMANLVLVTVTLHLLWVFWRGAYKKPRELTYWAGVAMLGILFFFYFTGTVMKNDQEAVEALAHNIAAAERAGPLGVLLTPGFTRSVPLLTRLYGMHVSVLPLALLGILGLHLWLIRYLDIHTHPGEAEGGSNFQVHLRKLAALGLLFFAGAALLAVFSPAPLLSEGVSGVEITKPPFFFLWIYAVENFLGLTGLVVVPPLVYVLFFLPPLIDRKPSARPGDRKLILGLGFGLMLVLLALAVYAKLAPAQQHLGM
ncbi:MAG: cytochrome b N-terminal domain-containing protein [Terriglobia bacterium]